jgi:riboflavin biosynthesis pyrimidine reductase
MHDAIMVGVNTVLIDNPRLTTRHVPGTHPQPIVVDSQLQTPLDANLMQREDASLIIATTEAANQERAVLRLLPTLGLHSLMVEGGARLITSVLKADVADQLVLAIAPRFLGGVRGVQSMEQLDTARRPKLTSTYFESVGGDMVVYGELVRDRS